MSDFDEWAEHARLNAAGKALANTAWQAAQAAERERMKELLIDHRTVTIRGGVVASITHVNYLPDDGVYKLYAVRIDDES